MVSNRDSWQKELRNGKLYPKYLDDDRLLASLKKLRAKMPLASQATKARFGFAYAEGLTPRTPPVYAAFVISTTAL